MTGEFSVFDYPRQILHVPVSMGETNQTTGAWEPESQLAAATITGDIQDLTARDIQRLPEGEFHIGDRRIFTTAVLADGDLVQVTEDTGSISEWTVKTLERATHILPKFGVSPRKVYLLKRRV